MNVSQGFVHIDAHLFSGCIITILLWIYKQKVSGLNIAMQYKWLEGTHGSPRSREEVLVSQDSITARSLRPRSRGLLLPLLGGRLLVLLMFGGRPVASWGRRPGGGQAPCRGIVGKTWARMTPSPAHAGRCRVNTELWLHSLIWITVKMFLYWLQFLLIIISECI